ncbi:MAG TPA: response regulator [Anaerolineales bacterium]|nr:response regulator [Anaerolineales bacterium]
MKKLKIFLVEDDPMMVSLLKTLLELEGYRVNNPPLNRANIIGTLLKEDPDLILMDVLLGRINGLDVLKKMKTIEQLKNKKILMTSGTNLEVECMRAGADGFIMKPYMPDELMKKIQLLTNG